MKKYEFRHVRMKHGLRAQLSRKYFEAKLASILAEMGDNGWDLKGIYSEALTMHTHLVFGREKT